MLLICDKLPFFATSADSLASCSCHGCRVKEVKCPFSHKESTLKEYIKDLTSCLTEDGRALKNNHKYYSKVQLHLFVHNVETYDLVMYTLRMTAILHISRDNNFISRMTERVKVFYLNCVIPELLTRKLEHSAVTLHNSVTDHIFYCLYHSKDDGKADMIGCDNPKCKKQWLHLKCINMKRVPKGQWFCNEHNKLVWFLMFVVFLNMLYEKYTL